MRRVQVFPQALQLRVHGVRPENAAAEQRVMPVRHDARVAMLAQILPQPFILRRTSSAASQSRRRAIRVQHHYVPRAEFIAVVAFASGSGLPTPILKIRGSAALPILVVPQRRPGAVLEFAPRGAIAVLELRQGDGVVAQVSCHKNRPWNLLDEFGGSQSVLRVLAADDVPGSHEYGRLIRGIGFYASTRLRSRSRHGGDREG